MTDRYSFDNWKSGVKPPKGWDAADATRDGWSKADLDDYMRATVRPWMPKQEPAEQRQPEPAPREPAPPSAGPVTQVRTTQQEQPATVTSIKTRKQIAVDQTWETRLIFNDKGKIVPGLTQNWGLTLECHPEMDGVFAWDAFKLRVMLMMPPPWEDRNSHWEPRAVQDRDFSEAVMWLEQRHMTPKASNIVAVIQTIAEHNTFDRLTEYLESLKWDGTPRLKTFLPYYFGCDPSVYAEEIGKNWLVSSVARGLKPGCKVDTMPILEGPQGLNKSTAVKALYGAEFFSDNLSDIGTKDAMMEMQGVWGLEVAEMHRFSAAETNAVKKFLSRDVDRFRPPYGRSVIDAPRRVVMTGTINPEGNPYLRDPTGARRFWPVTCGRIDIDALAFDRDQLWAEAVHVFRAGSKWWVNRDDIDVMSAVEAEQEKRTDVDVWVDMITPFVSGRRQVAQLEIFKELGILPREAGWVHSQRLGRIMKKLGWDVTRDRSGMDDRVMFVNPNFTGTGRAEVREEIF